MISLHAPHTTATHHLLDRSAFARMRSGAIVINSARGGLVHTEALIEALDSGALAGAALDTFEVEPLPASSALCGRSDVLLTPHMAWSTDVSVARTQAMTKAALEAGVAGDLRAAPEWRLV